MARVPRPVAHGVNTQWTIDFSNDELADGRRFRTLSVLDEHTRDCLARWPDVALPSATVVRVLAEIVAVREAPQGIMFVNSQEMITRNVDARAHAAG